MLDGSVEGKAEQEKLNGEAKQVSILGLNFRTNVNDIYKAFSKYGKITSCKLVTNDNNESKGFAFITYSSTNEAQTAIDLASGKRFDGKNIKVVWSLSSEGYSKIKIARQNMELLKEKNWRDFQRTPTKR